MTAGQVTDPGTGEPGLAVRFLDGDGTVLHAEHRLAGKLIWMGLEVLRRTATVEVVARLRARVDGEHRIGVAGTGEFRLTAGDRTLVDERIQPDTDDAAGLLAAPSGPAGWSWPRATRSSCPSPTAWSRAPPPCR